MRILNIYYKNINSLEGEGRVHFDQGPIADSGVFAITGPNGSGKTSILDVITLGLYGETFRFDKPAQHVITKHTDESLAQVEFALGSETFRSTWQVRRADEAVPQMSLQRLGEDSQVLAESPGQVRSRLAELTGMDFHRFSKAIVLPQGDFAAFLNALDSERMDILEKISGPDLYADFRRQAESRYDQARQQTATLEHELGLIPLLDDAAIEAAEHDLQDYSEQHGDLERERTQLQQQLQNLQQIAALENQQQSLGEQIQLLQDEIEHRRQDLRRIAAYPQARLFIDDLRALEAKLAEAERHRTRLNQYRSELNQLQQQLAASGEEPGIIPAGKDFDTQQREIDALKLKISELKLKLASESETAQSLQHQQENNRPPLSEVEDWLNAHQVEASLLTDFPDVVKLRNLRTELAELSGKHRTESNWAKKSSASLKKGQSALDEAESRVAELKIQIEADQKTLAELAQGRSHDELNELLRDQQNRVEDLRELYELANVNAKLSDKGLFSWFGRKNAPEPPDEQDLQSRVDALKLELASEENIATALQQLIANEILVKRLSEYRDRLVDGKPCFLCGSLHHPYVLKPPVAADSKKALADQRGKIQSLKSRLDSALSQLTAAQKQNNRQTAKQKFLQQKRSEWLILANRLNVMREGLTIDDLGRQKRLLAEESEELEKLSLLVKKHAQLQRNIARDGAEIESHKASLPNLRAAADEMSANWSERFPKIAELETKFNQLQADQKALIERLEKQLARLGEKLPGKGKENACFDRLNSRRQDYQIRELRQKGLREEMAALEARLKACNADILRDQQELTQTLEALRKAEGMGLHLALLEKQRLIVAEEQGLADLEMEMEAKQRALSDQIIEQGFADLDELQHLLKLGEQQEEIQQTEVQLTTRLASLQSEWSTIHTQLATASANTVEMITEADLLAALKQLAGQIDIAEQEIRTLRNKLDKQRQYRDKFDNLENQLVSQRKILAEAEAEIEQINDGQGGLRRKVQQLLIDRLLAQANQILEKISGRYYLRSAPSDHGLALEIEDTKQRNARRQPKTLSGGESFVVSLALALALAEMATDGKTIESLFLDEGFGNLDAESLYLAMGALEGLRIQGKTVGVISHVEGVKKRIKTQIELVKKPNGLSELRMVA